MSAYTIEIEMDEYNELVADQKFLRCLEAAGVNDWDGFEVAQEMFQEQNPEKPDE
jgi:hypothetical protein